jgi:hypothetical protein
MVTFLCIQYAGKSNLASQQRPRINTTKDQRKTILYGGQRWKLSQEWDKAAILKKKHVRCHVCRFHADGGDW